MIDMVSRGLWLTGAALASGAIAGARQSQASKAVMRQGMKYVVDYTKFFSAMWIVNEAFITLASGYVDWRDTPCEAHRSDSLYDVNGVILLAPLTLFALAAVMIYCCCFKNSNPSESVVQQRRGGLSESLILDPSVGLAV